MIQNIRQRYPHVISGCPTNDWNNCSIQAQKNFESKYWLVKTNTLIIAAEHDLFVYNRAMMVFANEAKVQYRLNSFLFAIMLSCVAFLFDILYMWTSMCIGRSNSLSLCIEQAAMMIAPNACHELLHEKVETRHAVRHVIFNFFSQTSNEVRQVRKNPKISKK